MRDLQKDLEICNKATEGPWRYVLGSGYNVCTCLFSEYDGQGKSEFIAEFLPDWVLKEKISVADDHRPNMTFVKESREGWPEAINRAIAAEARVKDLDQTLDMICDNDEYYSQKLKTAEARVKELEDGIREHQKAPKEMGVSWKMDTKLYKLLEGK